MNAFGIPEWSIILLFNFAILLTWPLLSLAALLNLRHRGLSTLPQAVWVLIILAVPYLGAIAFWIMRPSENV